MHFAAATALVHGMLPYRDFLFLQPPGIVLLLSPFAALGTLLGDDNAFAFARAAFVLLGTCNAALIWIVLRRVIPGALSAFSGSALYAVSWPAIYVEQTTLLEVPGTTAVLSALLLVVVRPSGSRWWGLFAGFAIGLGVGVKIWYLVPALVIMMSARGRRTAFFFGGTVAVMVVYTPLFIAAPPAMWRQVVSAQLGRPRSVSSSWERITAILGLTRGESTSAVWLVILLVSLAVIPVLLRATRVFVMLTAACLGLLLVGPSFFQHYTALTAAPLALVAGAAVGQVALVLNRRWADLVLIVLVLATGLALTAPQLLVQAPASHAVPAGARAASNRVVGCLTADDPTALILLRRLDRDLQRGCPLQVDPSGAGYLLIGPGVAKPPPRSSNPLFQEEVLRYLQSGDGYVLVRGSGLGLSSESINALQRDITVYNEDRLVLRRVR